MSSAVLYVEIVPTTKGIKGQVEGEFSAGFKGVESNASTVFGRIAGFAKSAATVVTGAAAALAGVAVKGGISRLLNIEDATAKLKGLGNSAATVTEIMNDALASVKGTAFGLDDAATIAASAVAAGVKPGQELTRYLKLTADAATIAGGSLSDLGSVMNNVTTLGAAYNDSLQILAQKGLPIYSWLASELGISTDAVKELASEGKISAAQFQKAIEDNISGAALSAGDTTRGAFANLLASLNRIGANLLSGVFPLFKATFQGITELLAPLEAKAATVGQAIAGYIVPAFEKISASSGGVLSALSGLSGVIGPLAGAFAALGAGGLGGIVSKIPLLDGLAGPLTALGGPIGILVGAIGGLVAVSPELRDALGGALQSILTAVVPLLGAFQPLLPVISDLAVQIGGVLAKAVILLVPFVTQIIGLFGSLIAQLLPVLIPVISQVAGVVLTVVAAFLPLIGAILPVVVSLIQMLVPIILQLVNAFIPLLTPILALIDPLVQIVVAALTPLLAVLQPVIDLLGSILTPIVQVLAVVFKALSPILTGVAGFLKDAIVPAVSLVATVLGDLIKFVVDVFQGKWGAAWDDIQQLGKDAFNGLVKFGVGIVNGLVDLINGLTGAINGVTANVGIPAIPKIPHIPIPKLANGANITSTGTVLVGDAGPELLKLPRGAQVQPLDYAADVRSATQGTGGVRDIYFQGTDPAVVLARLQQQLGEKLVNL